MKINSYILKINGAVEVPSELVAGFNYNINIEGAIPKFTMSDNHDGSYDVTYTLKPIKVSLIDQKGETLKAKDPRSNSNKARSQALAIHLEKGLTVPFEEFYDKLSALQRHLANDLTEKLIKDNNW